MLYSTKKLKKKHGGGLSSMKWNALFIALLVAGVVMLFSVLKALWSALWVALLVAGAVVLFRRVYRHSRP
jgi:Flp pilus assembly protein TadB